MLEWDTRLFGRQIGKLTSVPSAEALGKAMLRAKKEGYEYLSCRLVLGGLSEVQLLERHGFYTTDIGAVLWRGTDNIPGQTYRVKRAISENSPLIESMSRGLFRESRFYNDPFFSKKDADMLYRVWLSNSLRDNEGMAFFIKDKGFIVCQKEKKSVDIGLIGVVPQRQGRGIGSSLVCQVLTQMKAEGINTLTVRTQTSNVRAMNFYLGLGFRVRHTDVTMGLILKDRKHRGR